MFTTRYLFEKMYLPRFSQSVKRLEDLKRGRHFFHDRFDTFSEDEYIFPQFEQFHHVNELKRKKESVKRKAYDSKADRSPVI